MAKKKFRVHLTEAGGREEVVEADGFIVTENGGVCFRTSSGPGEGEGVNCAYFPAASLRYVFPEPQA